jgi:hypothetical protein
MLLLHINHKRGMSSNVLRLLPSYADYEAEAETASDLPVEDFLFSAGGGFLFGAVAGYAIKKVMKIAAVIVGTCSWLSVSVIQGLDRCQVDRNGECHKVNIGKCNNSGNTHP